MFVQIQKAYDILSDPERRTDYDSTGNTEYKADSVVQTTIIEMVMSLINQLDVAVQDPLETAKRQTSQKCRLKPSALQVGGFLLMKGVNCPHVQTFQAIR